jgi:hypothetical protein
MDEYWDLGNPTDWEGELSLLDQREVEQQVITCACRRLNNPSLGRSYDTSGMGSGTHRMPNRTEQYRNELDAMATEIHYGK